jgi:hypothetical protein
LWFYFGGCTEIILGMRWEAVLDICMHAWRLFTYEPGVGPLLAILWRLLYSVSINIRSGTQFPMYLCCFSVFLFCIIFFLVFSYLELYFFGNYLV